jgi:hypothetical protein
MDYNLKKNPDKTHGDTIEIRLKDITLNIYFKGVAHINSKKEMYRLVEDLRQKGVTFDTSWF